VGSFPSITATQEFVVPKSIPIILPMLVDLALVRPFLYKPCAKWEICRIVTIWQCQRMPKRQKCVEMNAPLNAFSRGENAFKGAFKKNFLSLITEN
jgi:hypothetical protein